MLHIIKFNITTNTISICKQNNNIKYDGAGRSGKYKEHLSDAKGRFQERVFHGEHILYFRSMPFVNERLPKELQ